MPSTAVATPITYVPKATSLPTIRKHAWTGIRRQKPIKGGRESLPSSVIGDIYRAVEKREARYGVSRSFLIAVILADYLGVDEQERF